MSKLVLKSEQNIISDMAKVIMARTGLNDLNPGSILLTLLQAAAQEDFAQYYQMLQIIRNYNLDTTSGTDLDNRAFEYGITRIQNKNATGKIIIQREEGFSKIATSYYSGFRSRIAGDTELYLNNAEDFPTTGGTQTIILGRGTPNEEEVTYTPGVTNPQNFVNYYKITLLTPLTNDHGLEETVILKQGVDITIPAGTVVVVPATARTPEISFNVTTDMTLLAGEAQVEDVDVACTQLGRVGNVGVNSIFGITAFKSPPFANARAYNDAPFSNGEDRETDTKLRNRIKAHIQSLSQSTPAGVQNAIVGLVDSETAKRVVSSSIVLPANVGLPVKLYIDDGTGFEPSFSNRGQEVVVASAKGGETKLQLDLFPLVKAQVETLNYEPFDMSTNGLTLVLNVGSKAETLTFFTNSFAIPEAATSEELVRAINDASALVEARTSQVGKKIVINAKEDTNEDIQVVGGSANVSNKLNFPTSKVQTFYLYKNDIQLSKDGETAFIDSGSNEAYNFSGVTRQLLVVVDGKVANVQTITIAQADFDSPAAAASAPASKIAELINLQLAGATATAVSGKVRITSNTELSSASKIKINGGTANTILNFSTTEVAGKNQDYKLNPELGVVELSAPLLEYDLVTAGTRGTRAFLTASIAQDYTFVGGETLQIKIDGGAAQTITFVAGTNQPAQTVADFINTSLVGGTAVVRTVGLDTYLEIRTNTFSTSGSIEILSASTANPLFLFEVDFQEDSILPHVAFVLSGSDGPYVFVEGETLVIVLDNDTSGKTFVITFHYNSQTTSGVSTTQFSASGLIPIFLSNGELTDFWAVFKSGVNTITGTITDVTNPVSGTFRYIYDTPPLNFGDFAIGDQASFSAMANAENDGNFLVTGVVVGGTAFASVIDKDLSNPSLLTPVIGDRYLVHPDANTTTQASVLDKDTANPALLTPSIGDKYIIEADANDVALANVKGQFVDSADVSVLEVHGYRYIVNGVGLNDWAAHNWEIAQYNGVGSPGWIFITPVDKDVVYDEAAATYYQYDGGLGQWVLNRWGSKAGKVATWSGAVWTFTNPIDKEVRLVSDEAKLYQYNVGLNSWSINDWGGSANKIAQWGGAVWTFTTAAANDTVPVTDEAITYQFNGSLWAPFKFWVEINNTFGVTEVGSTGVGLIGQRRKISNYNATSGLITLLTATRATPGASDDFVIIPGTRTNVRNYLNNLKLSSLSTKANIELAELGELVQISSKQDGSDGFVQVTGGRANVQLGFSTTLMSGLRAYAYYTGLIKLCHRTIYGDEQDYVAYPGVGAAGVKFQILPPTTQEVSVSAQITLAAGRALSSLENDVKTAIISYINNLGVGEKVIVSKIVEAAISVSGVTDVNITNPTLNVDIAVNELARTKASLISIS